MFSWCSFDAPPHVAYRGYRCLPQVYIKPRLSRLSLSCPSTKLQHEKAHSTSTHPSLLRTVTGPPSQSSAGFGVAVASARCPILILSPRNPSTSYPSKNALINPRISVAAKLRPGHRCVPPPKGIYAARRFFSVVFSVFCMNRSGLKSRASAPHTSGISCATLADHMT